MLASSHGRVAKTVLTLGREDDVLSRKEANVCLVILSSDVDRDMLLLFDCDPEGCDAAGCPVKTSSLHRGVQGGAKFTLSSPRSIEPRLASLLLTLLLVSERSDLDPEKVLAALPWFCVSRLQSAGLQLLVSPSSTCKPRPNVASAAAKVSLQAKIRAEPNLNKDPDRRCLEAGRGPLEVDLPASCVRVDVPPLELFAIAVNGRGGTESSSKLVSRARVDDKAPPLGDSS